MGLLARLDRKRALLSLTAQSVNNWLSTVHEPFTGAWQMNATEDNAHTLTKNSAVFHCVTGISNDIAKMRVKLSEEDDDGIWNEIKSGSPFLPVLRKPNHFQTRLDFFRSWVVSLMLHGNAYMLKERDQRGIVTRMYVLDPSRVTVLQAPDSSIYYQLREDLLSGVDAEYLAGLEQNAVPAEEMIHDHLCELWHPLVGVSPLYAAALAATMARRIQDDSTTFFANSALPGGVITGPLKISQPAAERIKAAFEANFGGANRGRIAVMGENLKFEAMRLTAEASQLAEQYQMAIEDIARAFRYPLYKLTGKVPPYSSTPEHMTVAYYTDCLQPIIESIELKLDEGFSLPLNYGTEFDLSALIRMDSSAQIVKLAAAVQGRIMAPNEARHDLNLPPVKGGESPLAQKQDYNLEDLAELRQQEKKMANQAPPAPAALAPAPPAERSVESELSESELELLLTLESERELVTA